MTYSRFGGVVPPERKTTRPRHKVTPLEIALFVIAGVLLIVGAVAFYQQYSPSADYIPSSVAAGMRADRVNILLIGVAGERRVGGGNDLADAIMLVSMKPSTKQVALISVPRDFYVPIGRFGVHRLNAAHDIGYRMGYRGGGPGLLIDTVSSVTAQPIHGYARVDFAAFERLIDDLGGVDIYVYRPFRDYLFKDGFERGWQHMSGRRALQYARYRYVVGAEGNNFARELRQQQVLSAVRKKLQHLTVPEAMHILGSAMTVSRYAKTNLSASDMVGLYKAFHDVTPQNVRHVSLAPLTQIFMVTDPLDRGEAVRTPDGTFRAIQSMALSVFNDTKPIRTADEIPLSDAAPPRPFAVPGDDVLAGRAAPPAPPH